ncbi:hypothetical protein AB0E63_24625 [Kribbella sp. NPDC026596]|uniref:hypothetical protein n=1 Tax=Kribbella sp. NPDC026596 TaxID=3155122 RepID=UPI0033FE85EF
MRPSPSQRTSGPSPRSTPDHPCSLSRDGLMVGCEALFVPYAGPRAGWLLAAGAAGMMTGDLVVGRFLTRTGRRIAGRWRP